ncbi:Protein kinase-like domain protein [Metarhizium guizhouense ARSEF 977]|uniref:mitogen-activated protein kinase n=1 Tax=Metarhizium guizhouense (strain ARSEF 977) TaxID=1276136 RepID=A0A0B4GWB7_METGA|nr:Protein kinase-like domain protein [Metarhizium guizhouense ARSEF 977]
MSSAEDIPSSQGTNEDPTIPGSSAEFATITLTPENAEAKLAFSEVVEWLLEQNKSETESHAQDHARTFIWTASQQTHDADVTRFLRQLHTGNLSSSSPISSPHPDISDKEDTPPPIAQVWTGCYYISLKRLPQHPQRGYTAGSLRLGHTMNDLLLCLGNNTVYGVRQRQATLQMHHTGRVYLRTATDKAFNYVRGDRIRDGIHLFNDASTLVTFGSLTYRMQYTRFAHSDDHKNLLISYLQTVGGPQSSVSVLAMTPTPSQDNAIKVGQWSLISGTIGQGAFGKVSIALNSTGHIAALKRMSVGKDRDQIQRQREKLERFGILADMKHESRIVRLLEVITDDRQGANDVADVWFVLTPAVEDTLTTIEKKGHLATGTSNDRLGMVKLLIIDVLEALRFLHSHNILHSDIKPDNVGIRKWQPSAPSAVSIVLLDMEDCLEYHQPGYTFPSDPGTTGTVGWLSPEREMEGFSHLTDIWSVGVMALWALQRRHPWRGRPNPWRVGHEYARERPGFFQKYGEGIAYVKTLRQEGTDSGYRGRKYKIQYAYRG